MAEWTTGRKKGFITSVIRAGFRKWPEKYKALKKASVGKKLNPLSKRMAEHYECAMCKKEFVLKDIQVDHIDPAIDPEEGFTTWDNFIDRLYCETTNLQILCKKCHTSIKTKAEREISKRVRGIRAKHPREESSYRNMMSRCFNPKATGYEHYGGRGITVCDRWKESFYNFYEDMGERPKEKSLDRIDVNGDYTVENCRWASAIEQLRNTTANNFIDYNGEILCLEEWSEKTGIKANTILYRLRRGWPVEEALEFVDRCKKTYNGRLSVEDIEDLVRSINSGVSQTEYGRTIGMDSSQVCRIYHKFKDKSKLEASKRKKK